MEASDIELEQHKCENCGARISADDHKCPYCGGMNYMGAKKKYFKDLGNIKDDLEQLERIPVVSYKKEASIQIRRITKTISICIVVIIFIYVAISLFLRWKEKEYSFNSAPPKEQLLWDQENFPMLDKWYEAEEYDKLLELQYELYSKDKIYTYNNWEHEDFLSVYEDYNFAMGSAERIKRKEKYSIYDISVLIHCGLTICYHLEKKGLDEDEIARMEVYRPDAETFLLDTLDFTEEEVLQLYKDASKEGFIDYQKIEEYSSIVISRLN